MSDNVIHAEFRSPNFEKIRSEFAQDIPSRVAAIKATWSKLEIETWNDQYLEDVDQIITIAHSLSGTSLTFGFEDIGRRSRLIQELLIACYKNQNINQPISFVVDQLIVDIENSLQDLNNL
ncbi:MAG: Hpt domain-containing protein [Gammaproteobacteria bacterium]|nr:Hpt domain-containing protein [Gammaproteobacteria bacterium]MDH5730510.1 Hpt domain-containing protein [Gammaproteobacteria bacterium]